MDEKSRRLSSLTYIRRIRSSSGQRDCLISLNMQNRGKNIGHKAIVIHRFAISSKKKFIKYPQIPIILLERFFHFHFIRLLYIVFILPHLIVGFIFYLLFFAIMATYPLPVQWKNYRNSSLTIYLS